jgi:hypothetical protein
MTRFRELPGGIDRASYLWPMITAIHPEYGSYQMDVHCVRDPKSGAMSLIAFSGYAKPNSPERRRRLDLLADVAREMNNVIHEIDEDDVTADISVRLAAEFYANPESKIVVMQVARP